uniref:uncharacterized protein LOC105352668 n=1 Tax=Fragaria vesca subsp. vesca TaxID=101020 RepID=UPI0005CA0C17|nr:PREDICTED: uncharacterized protein LOC105352668 [Fragaria vesca subsp. vesca]
MAPSSEANSVHSTATSGPGEVYKCRHCEKTFRNGQALGGHQNAHRSVHRGVMRRIADAVGSLRNPQQLAAGPASFESCEVNQVVHLRRKIEPQNPREGKTRVFKDWRDKAAVDSDSERTVSESVVPKRPFHKRNGEEVMSAPQNVDLELKLGL